MKPIALKRPNFKFLKIKETSNVCKKVYFGTKQVADDFILKRSKEKDARPATSYLCHKCNCWHITSWEAPDITHFIKQVNEEIEAIENEYYRQYDQDNDHIEFCLKSVQSTQIALANLRLENYKLKNQIEKLKK